MSGGLFGVFPHFFFPFFLLGALLTRSPAKCLGQCGQVSSAVCREHAVNKTLAPKNTKNTKKYIFKNWFFPSVRVGGICHLCGTSWLHTVRPSSGARRRLFILAACMHMVPRGAWCRPEKKSRGEARRIVGWIWLLRLDSCCRLLHLRPSKREERGMKEREGGAGGEDSERGERVDLAMCS